MDMPQFLIELGETGTGRSRTMYGSKITRRIGAKIVWPAADIIQRCCPFTQTGDRLWSLIAFLKRHRRIPKSNAVLFNDFFHPRRSVH
jgi:hypothetical protein